MTMRSAKVEAAVRSASTVDSCQQKINPYKSLPVFHCPGLTQNFLKDLTASCTAVNARSNNYIGYNPSHEIFRWPHGQILSRGIARGNLECSRVHHCIAAHLVQHRNLGRMFGPSAHEQLWHPRRCKPLGTSS